MHSLVIENLSVCIKKRSLLRNISFELDKGDSLCIIGKSGSGKSVLLKSILGIIPVTSGSIYIEGNQLGKSVEQNALEHNIAISFQNDCLFDSMTIQENLCFPLVQRNKMKKNKAIEFCENVIQLLSMDKTILSLYPSELSGGMKKRIAIARSIITSPALIFFDEPTTGLDPITSAQILEIMHKYINTKEVISITVTHSLQCTYKISNKVLMIDSGNLVWVGNTTDMETTDNKYIREFVAMSKG